MFCWLVLSDEQMSKRWQFSLLNDEQMSNWVGVKHLPVFLRFYYIITGSILLTPTPESGIKEVILDSGAVWVNFPAERCSFKTPVGCFI